MGQHANMVKVTAAAPGTSTVTVSTAVAGFRTFAQGYNSADATVAGVRIEDASDATIWEICENCAYTHSGTTLSRGTRKDSSTGGAVNFTGAVVVSVIATADMGRRWDSAALVSAAATVTTADVTGVVGQMSELDISGLTAARSFVLPTGAPVGSRCGLRITAGYTGTNYAYGLKYTAGTAETLNGVAAGTEVSRCIITNEMMVFVVVSSGAWKVDYDGRIAQHGLLRLSTSSSGESAITWTSPTDASGAWTADINVGSVASTSNGRIYARRAGNYIMSHSGRPATAIAATKYYGTILWLNGTTTVLSAHNVWNAAAASEKPEQFRQISATLAAGDYTNFQYQCETASVGTEAATSPRLITSSILLEVL